MTPGPGPRVRWAAVSAALLAGAAVLPEPAGARPAPDTQAPGRDAPAGPAQRQHPCAAGQLPRTADEAARPGAARALSRCLTPEAPDASGGQRHTPGQLSLTARTLTVTGLMCAPSALADGVCSASAVTAEAARIRYGEGAGVCTSAPRLTVRGSVRLRAADLRGRLFGVLPVRLSTRALPPLPLPYVQLTSVVARDVSLAADDVRADQSVMGPGPTCETL